MKRVFAFILGPRPELRAIIVLLAVIIYALFAILWQLEDIESDIPYIDNCGYSGDPCQVEIAS